MANADRQKWDARYAAETAPEEPSAWLVSLSDPLPNGGRALDVAGGAGRNAIWLAKRGLCAGLSIVSYEEGWTKEGRHEARCLARCCRELAETTTSRV